ncbi:MAG: dienelactone hydrolase family protein, partial [Planctomycetota bacterium]
MTEVMSDSAVMQRRFNEALTFLNSQEGVDPERTGAIGYCMGGGIVLAMLRAGADLDAVASFHGSLGAALEGGSVPEGASVLVCTGADDPFVPAETLEAFETAWSRAAGVGSQLKVISYPDALHGFTNPGATAFGERFDLPLRYDAEADVQSWAAMKAMFAGAFE